MTNHLETARESFVKAVSQTCYHFRKEDGWAVHENDLAWWEKLAAELQARLEDWAAYAVEDCPEVDVKATKDGVTVWVRGHYLDRWFLTMSRADPIKMLFELQDEQGRAIG